MIKKEAGTFRPQGGLTALPTRKPGAAKRSTSGGGISLGKPASTDASLERTTAAAAADGPAPPATVAGQPSAATTTAVGPKASLPAGAAPPARAVSSGDGAAASAGNRTDAGTPPSNAAGGLAAGGGGSAAGGGGTKGRAIVSFVPAVAERTRGAQGLTEVPRPAADSSAPPRSGASQKAAPAAAGIFSRLSHFSLSQYGNLALP